MEREEEKTQVSSVGEDPELSQTVQDERDKNSLSARKARLRGLVQAKSPVDPSSASKEDSHRAAQAVASNQSQEIAQPVANNAKIQNQQTAQTVIAQPVSLPAVPGQAMQILSNIDQAMEACAINLATLQKIAFDQTDALKNLANTLQNQTFSEISLNLSSLTEALAAALEPMKAVGELIPSLDELVSVIGTRDSHEQPAAKLSADELLINLSDQLANGLIDSWTFKCACLAIDSNERPADLLHRLVDLLSAQKISPEVFRAAYDAIQEAEPDGLKRSMAEKSDGTGAQFDNAEAAKLPAQMKAKSNSPEGGQLEERQASASKSELSLDQLEEVNRRYDELNEAFMRHERILQERESELALRQQELLQKDSENKQLKAQMDELIELTRELQKQATQPAAEVRKDESEPVTKVPAPEVRPSPSFFDLESSSQPTSLFDSAKQPASLFEEKSQNDEDETLSLDRRPAGNANQTPATKVSGKPAEQAPINVNKPQAPSANAPFVSGAGSYGSGVRAQVFEVIVRQALAGAEWREICAGPMQVNNISPEEVESEVKRRQALLKK